MKPQEDLAALLERGDWDSDDSLRDDPQPRSEGRRRKSSDRRPEPPVSKEGIEALLSGYLSDDES